MLASFTVGKSVAGKPANLSADPSLHLSEPILPSPGRALLAMEMAMATINLEWVWDSSERGLGWPLLNHDKPMSKAYRLDAGRLRPVTCGLISTANQMAASDKP
jgi:hypothetical protein